MNASAIHFDYAGDKENYDKCFELDCHHAIPSNPDMDIEDVILSLKCGWRDSIHFYTTLTRLLPHLTDETIVDLFSTASNDNSARNAIVLNNLGLALSKIISDGLSCYNSGCADWEDYLQDCIESLLHTAMKFDYSKGYEFSTYATSGMKKQISQSIADNLPISIPKDISNAHHKVTIAREKAENMEKTETELVNEVLNADGAHSNLVKRYLNYKEVFDRNFISLQKPLKTGEREKGNNSIGATIKDDYAERSLLTNENRHVLHELINYAQLDENEKIVLEDVYATRYSMNEIADRHGLSSADEGRTIQQRALRKLRKAAREMNLAYNDLF